MSETIRTILDAVTERVLAYRPKDKGLAAKKAKRRIERQREREGQDSQ